MATKLRLLWWASAVAVFVSELLLAASIAHAQPALKEVTDRERFQFFNGCRGVYLSVTVNSTEGVREDVIKLLVENRLEEVGIFEGDVLVDTNGTLSINVIQASSGWGVTFGFRKWLTDEMTNLTYMIETWDEIITESEFNEGSMLNSISDVLHNFIDDYWRINLHECSVKTGRKWYKWYLEPAN